MFHNSDVYGLCPYTVNIRVSICDIYDPFPYMFGVRKVIWAAKGITPHRLVVMKHQAFCVDHYTKVPSQTKVVHYAVSTNWTNYRYRSLDSSIATTCTFWHWNIYYIWGKENHTGNREECTIQELNL
jgi:hypothetical protein